MRIRIVLRHAVHMLAAFALMACGSTVRAIEKGSGVREIPFSSIEGVQIGNAQDDVAKTGVTVLCFPAGAKTGVDISGGGPASRETPVLDPAKENIGIHAIVLSGGSAYGLAAADGVMQCLEEHDIGFDTGFARVPLVVQSCIFDLSYGNAKVRPDKKMGYDACLDALNKGRAVSGSAGAGTGATVGKLCGMGQSMKSGIGYHAVQIGDLKMGAVVVLNALGDVYSVETGQKIAGLMDRERTSFMDSVAELYRISQPSDLFNRTNTTIGAIVTNGNFGKAELTMIAGQTRNAYARTIKPVGTLADGDTVYAVSCGKPVQADVNMAGTLAAEVMAKAIEKAIIASRMEDKEYLSHCLGLPAKNK
ncbi:MAG: P1 family peptidase [Acidaminococcaceae bacterium]|nr:P1 family peptidase [Acidaminococcaceae bacterium]